MKYAIEGAIGKADDRVVDQVNAEVILFTEALSAFLDKEIVIDELNNKVTVYEINFDSSSFRDLKENFINAISEILSGANPNELDYVISHIDSLDALNAFEKESFVFEGSNGEIIRF